MAPKKSTAAKSHAKSGAEPKAASSKKASASKAASSDFDHAAEMDFINQKLGCGDDGQHVGGGSLMCSLATLQKKSKPVAVSSPDDVTMANNGEDAHGGRDDVAPANDPSKTRKSMCTPDKASTPVKSPFCKKNRVGSAKKGVQDQETPHAMETTSPVKSLTLEYDSEAAAAQYAEPTLESIPEIASSAVGDGSSLACGEKSTVPMNPDPEQHVKDFEKMLIGTSNVDVLRDEILGWVSKRAQLPEPGFDMLPTHLANQCRLIHGFMEKATLLGVEKKGIEEDMHNKVVQFNKTYEQMLNKIHERHPEDQSLCIKKKAALDRWIDGKKTDSMEPVNEIQVKINMVDAEISEAVGKVIEMKMQPDPTSTEGTQEIDDIMTMEIEQLMESMVPQDTIIAESTVVIDSQDSQRFDDRNPDDSPDEPKADGSDMPAVGDGVQKSGSSDNVAMKHIEEMPDGPAKSALLAILAATVGKGQNAQPSEPEPMDGVVDVIRRQDTTQLQAQQHVDDPDAVQQPDGTWMWKGPKGRLETWDQRQKRLAHNTKMCFNRSFDSSDCPDSVLKVAATRRYNSKIIGELFEDWLNSGKNWHCSATHLNTTRASEQRKRGKHVMRPKSWLVERYGLGVADGIIAEKRAMQAKKQPHEPQYCMRNPDLPNSEEHEMYRVFDSLEFEDEVTDRVETGFSSSGQMNEDQTREFMPVMMQGMKDMDGAMQYMTAPGTSNGQGGNVEPRNGKPGKHNKDARDPPKPKEKKVKGMKQQASGKIQVCSAKLTDIKIWSNKVSQSPLSEDMKKGYMAELQSREREFQDTKAGLEALYMRKETEEAINGCDELRCQFLVAIGNVDDLVTTYAGTVKSVKLAVEPPKPKAKAKAKGKRQEEPAA